MIDDTDREKCLFAGTVGHLFCGICPECTKPRHQCGHMATLCSAVTPDDEPCPLAAKPGRSLCWAHAIHARAMSLAQDGMHPDDVAARDGRWDRLRGEA